VRIDYQERFRERKGEQGKGKKKKKKKKEAAENIGFITY